jgi:hypothetical protein
MADRLLILYSRAGCHLCGEMLEALRSLQGLEHFQIQVTDVDGDPALRQRYGDDVPVLAHGGRELCRHHLDAAAILEYLAKIA